MLLVDGIRAHPKLLAAGAEAAWLWACMIDFSRQQLTDGLVPAVALSTLGVFRERPERLVERLVVCHLVDPVEGGWRVHDYFDFNDRASDVRAKRAEETARKASYRARHRAAVPSSETTCPDDVPVGHPRDRAGTRAGAYPRVGAGVGTGDGDPGEEREEGAPAEGEGGGTDAPHAPPRHPVARSPSDLEAFLDVWHATAAEVGTPVPAPVSDGERRAAVSAVATYAREELAAAAAVFWRAVTIRGRGIGLFVHRLPELVAHVRACGPEVPFGVTPAEARRLRRARPRWSAGWTCPHEPPCGARAGCELRQELEAARAGAAEARVS